MGNVAFTIDNCGWSFKFQCPRTWVSLQPTSDVRVRTCDVCLQPVYRCESPSEAADHARQGHCVAVRVEDESEATEWYMGEVEEV
jgi:hypothetical protein